MITFIRSFMVQTDNPHLKQAVVIGILKIAQESIFSDFNNPRSLSDLRLTARFLPFFPATALPKCSRSPATLRFWRLVSEKNHQKSPRSLKVRQTPRVSTLLDPEIEDSFGFTESEVEAMSAYFGLEDEMEGIKEWYNGYLFGGNTVIYNPWSIVSFLGRPRAGLKPHWIGTSDNRLIKDVIKLDRREAKMTIEKLLRKEEVRKPLLTNIPYPQMESDTDVVWSFLLHSGYLKASERQQERTLITWRLAIPNLEVETAWITVISRWLKDDIEINEHFMDFVEGIKETRPRLIERGLKRILSSMASYHDTARASGAQEDEEDRRENFYHGLVLGLLAYLGPTYAVDSNREYGRGRSDIVVVRKGSDPAQAEEAFVFEFKQGNSAADTSLEVLAQAAYAQAEGYLDGVREKWHPKELLILGIGFRGKDLSLYCEA